MTLWTGTRKGGAVACGEARVPFRAGPGTPERIVVGIRPEDVEVTETPGDGAWPASVEVEEPLGAATLLTLRVGDEKLRALARPREWPERVWVRWPTEKTHAFDAATGRRL